MFEYLGAPKRVYFGDHEQRIVSIWPKFAPLVFEKVRRSQRAHRVSAARR